MNDVIIRKARKEDAEGKGYVHYQSWIETYTNHFSKEVMERHSLERCITIASEYPENTYVAIIEGTIIGFVGYMTSRDEDLSNAGEIVAIYLLREYQGQGIGKQLLVTALKELKDFEKIALWVLEDNENARSFYTRNGFNVDGKTKELYGKTVIRMIKDQK